MPPGTAQLRILAVLKKREDPICDDCLMDPAEVSNRHSVNQNSRQLADEGTIQRQQKRCGECGKTKLTSWTSKHAVPDHAAWTDGLRYPRSRWALPDHLTALDNDFGVYLEAFEDERLFDGPRVHFYHRVVELTRQADAPHVLEDDRQFHELAYATLTSWGMHRQGPLGAKLAKFPAFSAGLQTIVETVDPWWGQSILEIDETQAARIGEQLAEIVERPVLVASETPMVTNAITLHFLLPDLVPPIDRSHAGRFFYGPSTGQVLPGPAAPRFEHMFRVSHRLAVRHAETLRDVTGTTYFCPGHAKGLNNAIIAYVRAHDDIFG